LSEGTETDLLEFYGTECGHCKKMKPLVERLELEANLKRAHNEANANRLKEYDEGDCGGIPFFYNRKTGLSLCGAHDYETLKKWALGQEIPILARRLGQEQ